MASNNSRSSSSNSKPQSKEFFYSNNFFDCVRMLRNNNAHFREFSPRHPLMAILKIRDGRLSTEVREEIFGNFISERLPEVIVLVWDWVELVKESSR